jgi:hypothetical protein
MNNAAFAVSYQGLSGPSGILTPPGSYPCSPECSATLDKHPLLPHGHLTGPAHHVHTVMVGGMPGWQIVLIAAAAALVAATAAVFLDRLRTARRKQATTAA